MTAIDAGGDVDSSTAKPAFGRVLIRRLEEYGVVRLLISVQVDIDPQERPLLAVVVSIAGPVVERDE